MNRAASFDDDGRGDRKRPRPGRPISVTAEDEREFLEAMREYKRRSGRLFPTWSEILEVLRSLGYEKRIWRPVGEWSPIPAQSIEGGTGPGEGVEMFGWFSHVESSAGPS